MTTGGRITFPHSEDWNFGAGSFTIDWWERRLGAGCVIARDFITTFSPFIVLNTGIGNKVYMTSTGSSWDIANSKSLGANPFDTWFHAAVVRSGPNFYTFQDGVVQDTWTSSAALITNSNPLSIGGCQSGNLMDGYIDELRISKGIARWTANFTPPAVAYY